MQTLSIEYRHQEFQFPLLDAEHCGTESEDPVLNGSHIFISLREYWYYNMVLNSNIHVKENKMKRETIQQGCHLTVGAHFLSPNVLQHTEKTETLDAVIVFQALG